MTTPLYLSPLPHSTHLSSPSGVCIIVSERSATIVADLAPPTCPFPSAVGESRGSQGRKQASRQSGQPYYTISVSEGSSKWYCMGCCLALNTPDVLLSEVML